MPTEISIGIGITNIRRRPTISAPVRLLGADTNRLLGADGALLNP